MIFISEQQSSEIITHELAYTAARAALCAAAKPRANVFPVVVGHAADPQNTFAVKSATDDMFTGLKVGSYFPTNDAAGLPRHGSIILLFDQTTGAIGSIVEASKLNAYRTSAANAFATDLLARSDAKILTIFGTGHQAEYEALALARVRDFQLIQVVGRDAARTTAFVDRLIAAGLPAQMTDAETATKSADVITTATTATAPLFDANWVQPGTHISAMGADTTGKQELPPKLFENARLFCDLPNQSRRIGEFQHASPESHLTAIGTLPTRSTDTEITIFDSSGISLQDLYVADAVIREIQSRGTGS
ncbi:ornithine cyclodeaminase family protein [Cochlodiniinecator piscidefendens]|uniref:ornithine cyclodeaminase family protein n=1 Tax=Cochlodiniinecator piscidefendens TaxID=2715756 RepID=UPI001408B258|nr:ornithine cyclodeaminase family protein [Cochlodiniinecator piscidefendens]